MDYPDLYTGVDPDAQEVIRGYCKWHIAPTVEETFVLDGPGYAAIAVPTLHLVDVISVTSEGVTYNDLEWFEDGRITGPAGYFGAYAWTARPRGLTVVVRHGFDEAPGDLKAAAKRLAQTAKAPGGATVRVGQVSVSGGAANADGIDTYAAAIMDRYKRPQRP